jgi:hypothetical protein
MIGDLGQEKTSAGRGETGRGATDGGNVDDGIHNSDRVSGELVGFEAVSPDQSV